MKKLFLALVLAACSSDHEVTMDSGKITYFKDVRTGVCFAVGMIYTKESPFDLAYRLSSSVPCQAVPASMLKELR